MRIATILTASLILAACGGEEDAATAPQGSGDANAAAMEAMTSGTIRPQAGQWEATGRVVDIDMPGIPADQKDMMLRMMGEPQSFAYCLTQDEAERDPRALWEETSGDCEFESFDMDGGTVNAVAVCRQQGTDARMVMSGTHTPTSYSSRMEMSFEGPDGQGSMIVENSGQRVGDCEGEG